MTNFGVEAKTKYLRGEESETQDDNRLFVISLFVGIGCLREVSPNLLSVLVAGAPPCQRVSGLNAGHLGLNDPRSGLYTHVERVRKVCAKVFSWCEICVLMESVFSMTKKIVDRWPVAWGLFHIKSICLG